MKLSDEDKELLTADELAAYEAAPDGDDEDADDAADDEGSTADESDDDTGDDGDDGDDEQPAKPAPADKAPAAAEPEADEAKEDAEDVAEAKPAAAYTFNAPADIADKLTALKTEERDAFKQLMEGEMTAEDYQAIKDRTDTERETLQAQKLKAELSAEMTQQQAVREWEMACAAFAAKQKDRGIDYMGVPELGNAFDAEVKRLALDPGNANKPSDWFLNEAHRHVTTIMNLKPGAPAAPAAPPTKQRPNPATIPPSLSKLPAAAESPTTDDKWAHLRSLPGDKLEKAIAAMTPSQLDEYMNSEA